MDISQQIRNYLMEHDTHVVVPGLGCFSITDKPSENCNGSVKTIDFDSENTEDGSIFLTYIAEKENITNEEAHAEVLKFYYKYFIKKLAFHKHVDIENFGAFSLNEACDFVFVPVDGFFEKKQLRAK